MTTSFGIRRTTRLALVLLLLSASACSSGDASSTTSPTQPPEPSTTTEAPVETTTTESGTTIPDPPSTEIWLGDIAGQTIQFQFVIDDGGAITGVVGSPSGSVPDLPLNGTFDGSEVRFKVPSIEAVFEGVVTDDTLTGTWFQSGSEVPVSFERQDAPVVISRPQEPQPPFPYDAIDVRFDNGEISLAGTLVTPEGDGPFPAVVFTTGSGAQDRDETLVGHKPFLVLADAFARSGIASLRFDDRGVGGSTGTPTGATTAELATDTEAAVEYMAADGRFSSIGIVGHSEGGLIGPIVAGVSDDVDFLVLLAGPGLPGLDVLMRQTEDLMRAEGLPVTDIAWQMEWRSGVMEVAASDATNAEAAEQIRAIVTTALGDPPSDVTTPLDPALADQFVSAFTDPWMRFFLSYDPRPALEALDIPVLALIGSLDMQISAEENIPALEDALSDNPNATVLELDGLNHLFQTAETGAVSEYENIEETFSPSAIDLVVTWIQDHTGS